MHQFCDQSKKQIYIHSDSRAPLINIKSTQHNSKLVWDCLQLLTFNASRNKVYLIWVPRYSGIRGNKLEIFSAGKGLRIFNSFDMEPL